MPPIERLNCKQDAVLWENTGTTGVNGEVKVDRNNPQSLKVRWINTKRDAQLPDGRKVTIEADVIVLQDIPINSIMWLGSLTNWNSTGSTQTDTVLMEVVQFDKTPNLKGNIYYRTVSLARYGNSLPPGS